MPIAVLDVGKTNKKLIIFSDEMKILDSQYKNFPANESGSIHFEQAEETKAWFLATLQEYAQKYHICAVSITTHGGTYACLNKAGALCCPVVAYTSQPDASVYQSFYKKFGDPRSLHQEFATPAFGGLVNLALGMYYVQTAYKEAFAQCTDIVCFPQYFAHALTGVVGAEPTSAACHSYLWDFKKRDWSRITDGLGIRHLLPATVQPSAVVLGTVSQACASELGLPEDCVVTHGVHDSNASLVPYLIKSAGAVDKGFVLNSTGTWCVLMCPATDTSLSESDLDRGVFYNINVFKEPVKTALFMGGKEHDTWIDAFKQLGDFHFPDYNPEHYQQFISTANRFIAPGVAVDTGPFPQSQSRFIKDGVSYTLDTLVDAQENVEELYVALNCSLAIQTAIMLKQVGYEPGMRIYIEGGFRKNHAYQALLTALIPDAECVLSDITEATAYGAGLLAQSAMSGSELKNLNVDIMCEVIPPTSFVDLDTYVEAFSREISS